MLLKKYLFTTVVALCALQAATAQANLPQWMLKNEKGKIFSPSNTTLIAQSKSVEIINNRNRNEQITAMRVTRFRSGTASFRGNLMGKSIYVGGLSKGDGFNVEILETTNTQTNRKKVYQRNNIFNIRKNKDMGLQ